MAGVRDTARAMARFNVSDAPTHRRFTAGYYASSLHRTRAVFARACPDMAPSIDVIVRAARKIGAAELLPTHRDMKPEHVLLDGSVPAFIDLDSVACADPLLDPALMLARFAALANVTSHADRIGTAAAAFAAEYLTRVPGDWRDRLAVYLPVRWSKSLACSIARRRGDRRGFGISSHARPRSSPHSEFPVV